MDYGARWYDGALGRFTGVDPLADQFPWVSTYNYAENEPVANIDLWGLQRYYTADGSYLTKDGDSNERRVLNQGYGLEKTENLNYDALYNNSREILSRDDLDEIVQAFVQNYRDADVEYLQVFVSKVFDDEDGSLFKGYLAGSISSSGDEEVVSMGDDPLLPAGWRREISVHNHPNPSRHRFSEAEPGGTFGSSGLEGDYYMGVSLQMDMFLTTKGQNTVLFFDHKRFYELLKADYRVWNNEFKGQRVSMSDMNKFGPRSVRIYNLKK